VAVSWAPVGRCYSQGVEDQTLEEQIGAVASLGEPVRRALYLYVVGQEHGVTHDKAAEALGITRALAVFHLNRLVEEGLLDAHFRRLTGRTGPGAGRPAKLYRRSDRQFRISLPPRSYELAARLFAQALETSQSQEAIVALRNVARRFGAGLGSEARGLVGPDAEHGCLLDAAQALLSAYGFQPQRRPSSEIRLRNCPFHALAVAHRDLVCGMNLALMRGLVDGLEMSGIHAVLDQQPGWCCVAFRQQELA